MKLAIPFCIGLFVLMALAISAQEGDPVAPHSKKGLRVFVAGHSFHVPVATPLTEVAKLAGQIGDTGEAVSLYYPCH